jgi:hypothetical protein
MVEVAPGSASRKLVTMALPVGSDVEAAALILARYRRLVTGGTGPIQTQAQFTRLVRLLSRDPSNKNEPITIRRLRHPWAVFGGTRDARGRITSFLTQALLRSAL